MSQNIEINVEYKKYTSNIDEAFNYTCYDYLRILYNEFKKVISNNSDIFNKNEQDAIAIADISREFDKLFPSSNNTTKYSSELAYGDGYTEILSLINKNAGKLLNIKDNNDKFIYHDFIKAIYENNNIGLEIANECHKNGNHKKRSLRPINKISPSDSDNAYSRANSVSGDYYWAMLTTCIPNMKKYGFQKDTNHKVLRHGTQAISIGYKNLDIYPTYKAYQEVLRYEFEQNKKQNEESKVGSIYFNLLKRSNETADIDPQRKRETDFTKILESRTRDNSSVAVITLPADDGFLKEKYLKSNKKVNLNDTKNEIISIATENKDDFNIPSQIKAMIFDNDQFVTKYSKKIKELLENSINFLNLTNKSEITEAERHALMFHFIKYEVTNFLIEELKPANHVNFTCKDAIDRGAVHDLYYHTIKSVKQNNNEKIISKEDFQKYLHSAAIQTKGREVNKHKSYLANTFNVIINNNNNNNNKSAHNIPWYIDVFSNNYNHKTETNSNNSTSNQNTPKTGLFKNISLFFKNLFFKIVNTVTHIFKPKEYESNEINDAMGSMNSSDIILDHKQKLNDTMDTSSSNNTSLSRSFSGSSGSSISTEPVSPVTTVPASPIAEKKDQEEEISTGQSLQKGP